MNKYELIEGVEPLISRSQLPFKLQIETPRAMILRKQLSAIGALLGSTWGVTINFELYHIIPIYYSIFVAFSVASVGIWVYSKLQSEWLSKYPDQVLTQENISYKTFRHIFAHSLGIIACSPALYSAVTSSGMSKYVEVFSMLYSYAFSALGYYSFFNHINQNFHSKKHLKIIHALSVLIDAAIPHILRSSVAERKDTLNELGQESISLLSLFSALKKLHTSNAHSTSYLRAKEWIPVLCTFPAVLFTFGAGAALCNSYIDRGNYYANNKSLAIFMLVVLIPPFLLLAIEIYDKLFNDILSAIYTGKNTNFLMHTYPRTAIALLAGSTALATLSTYSLTLNHEPDSLFYCLHGDCGLIETIATVYYLVGSGLLCLLGLNSLSRSAMRNYVEFFEDEEHKNKLQTLDLLQHIKLSLPKIRPEIMTEAFDSSDGHDTLIALGIEENISHNDSFFRRSSSNEGTFYSNLASGRRGYSLFTFKSHVDGSGARLSAQNTHGLGSSV